MTNFDLPKRISFLGYYTPQLCGIVTFRGDLCDSSNGGCFDGLHSDCVDENRGAESSLAFQLSLAEMNYARRPLPAAL